MPENLQNVFTVEEKRIFRTTLTVSKSGYYRVSVRYEHNNWDAWLKLDIVGDNGETMTYIPPLPRKNTETAM